MKLSLSKIKKLNPCPEGLEWYKQHGTSDLKSTLLKVNKVNPDWASWLFTRLMNRKQLIEISIFSAELVLPIFESKYPNDLRPRQAIEAAKKVLKYNNKKNREAAYTAARGAYASTDAASDAASDARAATSASYAAEAATSASYAAEAVVAFGGTNPEKIRVKIISQAVKILNRRKKK